MLFRSARFSFLFLTIYLIPQTPQCLLIIPPVLQYLDTQFQEYRSPAHVFDLFAADEPICLSIFPPSPMTIPFWDFAFHENRRGDVEHSVFAFGKFVDAHTDPVRHFFAKLMQTCLTDQVSGDIALIGVCHLFFIIFRRADRRQRNQQLLQLVEISILRGRDGDDLRVVSTLPSVVNASLLQGRLIRFEIPGQGLSRD